MGSPPSTPLPVTQKMDARVAVSLAVVALVAVPSTSALKCYQCADLEALAGITGGAGGPLAGLSGGLGGALKKAMPSCKEFFNTTKPDSRYEFDCPSSLAVAGLKPGCMKTVMGEVTMRTCQAAIPQSGCQEQGEVSICYCEGDLCNGAGLATPGLLLLAPAALLAILRG